MSAVAKFAPDPHRRSMIAKVKVAQKEMGLDEDTYRAVLVRVTGRRSAADLNAAQLEAVLADFRAKGWTPKPRAQARSGTAPKPRAADHPSAKKARAMWISLYQLGVVRDRSDKALESFARRQLHVQQLQWADQAQVYKLIEALKAMAERAGWSQDLAGVPAALQIATLKRRLLVLLCARSGAVVPECGDDQLDTWMSLAAQLPEKGDA